MESEEVRKLTEEIERYVADYNRMFGDVKLKIPAALFGRKVRRVTGMSIREFVYKTGKFWVVAHPNGGTTLRARSVPYPD